jgi:molybdate transport system ATP-binding protein
MKQAENWTIIGPNGSGKTTLLNLISGDHSQAYANDIHVFGRRRGSGETIWELKRHIGLVSSAFQLRYRKDVEVRDVILSGFYDSVGVYHRRTFEQMQMIAKWVRYLNLQHLNRRSFTTLSYGEQRMVLLARAMVKAPLLLILDEPCEGLDRYARSMMLSFIDAIGQYTGTHLLYVTHHHKERIDSMTHALHLHALSTGGYTADCTAL